MLEAYRAHVAERAALGIPPLPLTKQQTTELVELLKNPPAGEEAFLVELLTYRVPAGVDDAAKVKAEFLAKVSKGDEACALISRAKATELLGTMLGGFNIKPMIDLLADAEVGPVAAEGLKKTLLMFDYFHDVKDLALAGNANAKAVMQSWADAEWFTSRPEVPASQKLTVFKVTGETNTDDLSPAPDAWSRPDIPLHALAMLKNARPGITPEEPGVRGPIKFLEDLRAKGNLVAYVGDVVGTGSSRKSATNSVLWFTGEDIPFVPNKRFGGVCLGSKIAPIFFNTMEDAGALPIELDCGQLDMGDEIELKVDAATGKVTALKNGVVVSESQLKTLVILDEVRAGGRIPLIVGRGLTTKAREALDRLLPTLRAASDPVTRELYVSRVAERLGIPRETIATEAARSAPPAIAPVAPVVRPAAPASSGPEPGSNTPGAALERRLLRLLLGDRGWLNRAAEELDPERFSVPAFRRIYAALVALPPDAPLGDALAALDPRAQEAWQRLAAAGPPPEGMDVDGEYVGILEALEEMATFADMAAEKDPMVLRRRWQALSKEGQARFQMYLANARR
ncbi:MAG: hypothetical protein CVU28_01920, partial [Betaproteobacteria bacterium HGW-Betaproteobacteria-21]